MLEMHVSAGTLRIKIFILQNKYILDDTKKGQIAPVVLATWEFALARENASCVLRTEHWVWPSCLQEKKKKQTEIEAKRAEVRKRMEEASKAKKAKKGFMTPERKKKLRVSQLYIKIEPHWPRPHVQLLLRKKAAEELKKEQERKAAERRRIIEERCGTAQDVEDASDGMTAPHSSSSLCLLSATISFYISKVEFFSK